MFLDKYKKLFLKIQTIYFANDLVSSKEDIDKYIQYFGEYKKGENYFYTSIIDLRETEEIIRSNIRKSYLHLINQAKKKFDIEIKYQDKPSPDQLAYFTKIYNDISEKKGYEFIQFDQLLRIKNQILISYALYKKDILSGQLYIYDKKRIRLLNSFIINNLNISDEMKIIIGSANKYQHYSDILYSKKLKFEIFDLGGLFNYNYLAKGITFFKLGFSNNIEISKNFIIANTFKGKTILFLKKYF